eukprot:TRINITY_DN43764_c0_g1_i1.p1 TRINITY_DN43764_c0_g1~~TRINITY_DN43764_c0_g1_i1.p1  ORF type:complete len:925 (-),score=209.82 TRINITY_DN43764_c0_g1_i1:729-3251(-)
MKDQHLINVDEERSIVASKKLIDEGVKSLPDNLQQVVSARIDNLNPKLQMTIKVCSVIGSDAINPELVAAVHPHFESKEEITEKVKQERIKTVEKQMNELVEAGFFTVSTEPSLSFAFVNSLFQEVAYDMVLLEIRTNIHQHVLNHLERKYELDKSKVYHILAHHALKANQMFKAKDYSEQAGLVAMSDNSDEEAVRLFNIALKMYEVLQLNDAYHLEILHVNLAEALYSLGNYSQAIDHFAIALELNGNPIPKEKIALKPIVLKMVGRQVWKEKLPMKGKTFSGLSKANNRRATQILERITQAAVLSGNSDLAAYCGFKLVELCETVEDPLGTQLLIGYSFCCYISLVLSKTDLAQKYYNKALSTIINFTSRLPEVERAIAQMQIGMYAAAHGNWGEALFYLTFAKNRFKEYGERSKWRECTLMIGIVKHMQCELSDCLKHFKKLLRFAQEDGDVVLQSSAKYWLCLTELLYTGCSAEIDAELNLVKNLNEDANFDNLSVRITKEYNSFHTQLENKSQEMDDDSEMKPETDPKGFSKIGADLARDRSGSFTVGSPLVTFANRYAPMLMESPNLLWYNIYKHVHFLDLLLDGVEQLPQTDKKSKKILLRHAEQVLNHFNHNFPFPYAIAHQKLLQGRWEYLEGKASSAQKHWVKAAKCAQKSKMPFMEASCLYHLGVTRTDESRRDKALAGCLRLLKEHDVRIENHSYFSKMQTYEPVDSDINDLAHLLDDENSLLEKTGTFHRLTLTGGTGTPQGTHSKKKSLGGNSTSPSRALPSWSSSEPSSGGVPVLQESEIKSQESKSQTTSPTRDRDHSINFSLIRSRKSTASPKANNSVGSTD